MKMVLVMLRTPKRTEMEPRILNGRKERTTLKAEMKELENKCLIGFKSLV